MLPEGSQPRPAALIGAALLDAAALAVLLDGASTFAIAAACVAHVMLTVAAYLSLAPGSRRTLASAWMLCLPGIGLPVAFVTMNTRGAGDLQEFQRAQVPPREISPTNHVRAIAGHVPVCERLVSGVSRIRRSALATLGARRDADAIEILRWAVRHPDSELALDAALTLEELNDDLESRRSAARAAFAHSASFEDAVAAGDVLLDALWIHLIDDALISAYADEARRYYDLALDEQPERAPALTERLARLALASLRPQEAVTLLAPSVRAPGASAVLQALYNQAITAARQFTAAAREVHDAA